MKTYIIVTDDEQVTVRCFESLPLKELSEFHDHERCLEELQEVVDLETEDLGLEDGLKFS